MRPFNSVRASTVAATTAALELAALCRQSREFAEAEFWLAAADAVAWECNPQPLIAPQFRVGRNAAEAGRHRTTRAGLELPRHRSTVLRFRRDLRELRDRYRPPHSPAAPAEDDRET